MRAEKGVASFAADLHRVNQTVSENMYMVRQEHSEEGKLADIRRVALLRLQLRDANIR